jgi:hypothetical protein
MTRHIPRLTTLAVATLLLVAAFSTGAAAQSSDQNPVGELFTDDDGDSVSPVDDPQAFVTTLLDGVTGAGNVLADRLSYETERLTGTGETTALDTEANETVATLNDNAGELTDHLTNQTTLESSQLHVIELTDENSDDQATFYVELTYNETSDSFEDLEATADQPAGATVDEEHRFEGQLARNLNEETTYYIDNYAESGETVLGDGNYISRMAAQYGGIFGSNQFQSTLIDGGWGGLEDDGEDGD